MVPTWRYRTLPAQKAVATTLSALPGAMTEACIGSPALLVVGDVAGLELAAPQPLAAVA